MGLINTTAKILDTTARVLNEAAFGDIRNIFNGNLRYFRMRPIGLYEKSYDFMIDHLFRNIGNAEYTYDGYYTPIGEMSNPFYNYLTRVPWFYQDDYKNSTSNYIDYIRTVYGATLSVENINESNLFQLSEDAARVGYIDGMHPIESLANDETFVPNANNTGADTRLGFDGGYYLVETLRNAKVANDKRSSYENYITQNLGSVIGLNTDNIEIEKSYTAQKNEETGRFEDGVFSPLVNVESPVYDSNYGHYSDIGSYFGIYNSLSEKSKKYYQNNVYAKGKTFYPTIRDNGNTILNGKTYFGKIGVSVGHEKLNATNDSGLDTVAIEELQIRYIFSTLEEHSNITDIKNGGVYVYTENEYGSSTNITYASFNAGTRFGRYTSYNEGLNANDLLKQTNESFKKGLYKTIIARFHTDSSEAEDTDTTQTAVSKKYGLSHGRNLLKVTPDESESYDNPYCRVWTFHHQYHRLADAIRPMPYTAEQLYGQYGFDQFTADNSEYGFENGRVRLEKYGTLNKNNGLVNITPIDSSDASKKVDIKNCMFSIENLAWKDAFSTDASSRETFQAGGLSSEQKGPFGGRIMWFPPYDLKFNEDISVNWNENNFIGRGEGVYTYANTTRSGQLSFKILVDHPSIINYWENRGKSVSNSVDDIDDPEQQLLRFFAGCDMLTSKPATVTEPVAAIEDEAIPSPDKQVIKFFVFYPNNYSGIDDGSEFATRYLINGFGAGKTKDANGNTVDYRMPFTRPNESSYGGYEIRPGKPISGPVASERQENKNAEIWDVDFNSGNVKLYVQEGDSDTTWWHKKWFYRVDKVYRNQILKKASYIDENSFGLNSYVGLSKVAEHFNVTDTDNLYSFADVFAALEGGDVSSVLAGTYNQSKVDSLKNKLSQFTIDYVDCIGMASSQGYESSNNNLQLNRAKTIKSWLSGKGAFSKSDIRVSTGGTGGQGTGINNGDASSVQNKLWRSVEVDIYITETASKTAQAALSETSTPLEEKMHQNNIISTPDKIVETSANMGLGRIRYFNDLSANKMVEKQALKDRLTSIRMNHLSDNINGLALNLRESVRNGNVNVNNVFGAIADFSEHQKKFNYDIDGFIRNSDIYSSRSDFGYTLNAMHDNAAQDEVAGLNNTVDDKSEIATVEGRNSTYSTREGTNNNTPVRYDSESKFFSMLEKEEPFLHHKISDKIKYFDPAFHSISPEGFNARLTFLQQCTRQGPTIGGSDNGSETTANNLAFGRPPVCILRIGDFYYTKILIESLSFSFDPLMWDLNQEGIGVMPMIADINMRFKFIGGSSLAGHITRLQNALSFNYYANTEVYDNRSELAEYDENGEITKFKPNPVTNK